MSHKIKLPKQCLRTILSILSSSGWTDDPKVLHAGCSIFDLPAFDIKKPDVENISEAEALNWLNEEIEFELTERQRDAVKAALDCSIRKKSFGSDRYIGKLLDAFGFME